ncbi:hypothetical protein AB2N04_14675 [Nitratireductor sp. GISD-1A_MAKvit]|uniref:hypothetical protein n=1 Tax=Nitratireductor sp. GISD-1A_MAKvit TaxID=3234198 RepID=UPI0034652A4C
MKRIKDLLAKTSRASSELRVGLTEARERIDALKAQREEIGHIPPTMSVVRRRVDAFAELVVERSTGMYPSPEHFLAGGDYQQPNYFAMEDVLGRYLKRTLAASIMEEVESAVEEMELISEEEREARVAKIDSDILSAELAEEALIRAAEEAGFPVERRLDADPRAVLAPATSLP